MSELIFSAEDQREYLVTFLNLPEVVHEADRFLRNYYALVTDCLAADELCVGVALVLLLESRRTGLEAEAAGALLELIANRPGPARTCRVCGCTDLDCSGCVERTGGPCHWVEEDLCSACVWAGEGGAW